MKKIISILVFIMCIGSLVDLSYGGFLDPKNIAEFVTILFCGLFLSGTELVIGENF
jgi:hypothetical protein